MMQHHNQSLNGEQMGQNETLLRQRRFALVLSGDIGVAERLVGHLSLRASNSVDKNMSASAQQFYAFKKLYDLWMDEVQGTKRETPLFAPGREHEAISKGLDPSIAQGLGELPSLHRALLLLIYGENFSYAASAQLLNITIEQLMSALMTARKKFSEPENSQDLRSPPPVVSQIEVPHDAAR